MVENSQAAKVLPAIFIQLIVQFRLCYSSEQALIVIAPFIALLEKDEVPCVLSLIDEPNHGLELLLERFICSTFDHPAVIEVLYLLLFLLEPFLRHRERLLRRRYLRHVSCTVAVFISAIYTGIQGVCKVTIPIKT